MSLPTNFRSSCSLTCPHRQLSEGCSGLSKAPGRLLPSACLYLKGPTAQLDEPPSRLHPVHGAVKCRPFAVEPAGHRCSDRQAHLPLRPPQGHNKLRQRIPKAHPTCRAYGGAEGSRGKRSDQKTRCHYDCAFDLLHFANSARTSFIAEDAGVSGVIMSPFPS